MNLRPKLNYPGRIWVVGIGLLLALGLMAACSASETPAPTAAPTATEVPADTATPEPAATATEVPTETALPAPTDTPMPEPTDTPEPESTEAPAEEPAADATEEPAEEPTEAEAAAPAGDRTAPPAPADDAQLVLGEELYQETAGGIGCYACHGHDAKGDVGPDIRGRGTGDIQSQLDNNQAMQFMILSSTEIEALAAYLGWLSDLE